MSYTLEDYFKEVKEEALKHLTEEDIDEILNRLKPEERLKGLKPEEILGKFRPEDRLKGLKPEEILSKSGRKSA